MIIVYILIGMFAIVLLVMVFTKPTEPFDLNQESEDLINNNKK